MRAFSGLLRRQHRDAVKATREYAAQAAVIPVEESPFLRFANPVPQIYTHESILGEVPETKVGPTFPFQLVWPTGVGHRHC